MLQPESIGELTLALKDAALGGKTIRLSGASTKAAMAGPLCQAGTCITTSALRRVVQYDPRDLTVSVEAGLPFRELSGILAERGQMLPLDPPFFDDATVGGAVAANSSGPRRRLYGTARDMIIGMKFITLEGTLVQSGGMVVKNVAGLDMAKLLVGSFGTLAAMAVLNFKVVPIPPATRTFVMEFRTAAELFAARDSILQSVLQPSALDVLNPAGAHRVARSDFALLLQASGSAAVLDRYRKELPAAQVVEAEEEALLWRRVREFVPDFLGSKPEAVVVRTSSTLAALKDLFESSPAPIVARAGNGVAYLCFEEPAAASGWLSDPPPHAWKSVVEFAPPAQKSALTLWPDPGSDFAMLEKVKNMFDPGRLLNRGRLYGRI